MIENCLPIMTTKKHFLQHKEKCKNIKEAYIEGLKNIRKKVCLAVVFIDITRKRALSEEASIHTAEMMTIKMALKEITKDG